MEPTDGGGLPEGSPPPGLADPYSLSTGHFATGAAAVVSPAGRESHELTLARSHWDGHTWLFLAADDNSRSWLSWKLSGDAALASLTHIMVTVPYPGGRAISQPFSLDRRLLLFGLPVGQSSSAETPDGDYAFTVTHPLATSWTVQVTAKAGDTRSPSYGTAELQLTVSSPQPPWAQLDVHLEGRMGLAQVQADVRCRRSQVPGRGRG